MWAWFLVALGVLVVGWFVVQIGMMLLVRMDTMAAKKPCYPTMNPWEWMTKCVLEKA